MKIKIPQDISILLVLALALSLLRVIFFRTNSLLYLLWNIFLALLPFIVSSILLSRRKEGRLGKTGIIIGGIIWLLLIPNAPYIVTDLIHLIHMKTVPVIFDTFLLFTSAWVGLLLYFYSLLQIEQILETKFAKNITTAILSGLTIIISFGVYLGRFLRFNSWDIFAHPSFIIGGMSNTFSYDGATKEALIFIVISSVFLCASYWAWKSKR